MKKTQTAEQILDDFCKRFANKKPVYLHDKTVRKMFVQGVLKLFKGQRQGGDDGS